MAKILLEEMKGTHLRVAKQLDLDFSTPPWNNDTWKKEWTENKEAFGCIARNERTREFLAFALAKQTKEGYKIIKLVIKDDENYDQVASKLLHSFVGKVCIWVRGRNFKLCKILTKNKFKHVQTKSDSYKNPVDDGYKFEKLIENMSIKASLDTEESLLEGDLE